MPETFENSNRPKNSPDEVRGYIGRILEDESFEVLQVSKIMKEIAEEVKSLFSFDLLNKSQYWHAFAQSSIKEGEEVLPIEVDEKVGLVLEDLIERKLKAQLPS